MNKASSTGSGRNPKPDADVSFNFGANGGSAPPTDKPPAPPASPAPDPFDPASLRLSHNFGASLGVKKLLTSVPVRKSPPKTAFVRVHPSDDYSVATMLLEVEGDRDSTYLVVPELHSALAAEPACASWQLYTAIDRQGNLFLWKVHLPGVDGKSNRWWDSAGDAVKLARQSWVRVASDMALGAYSVWEATGELTEPDWLGHSFRDVLALAFRGKLIDALDHPVLRKLRGEV